MTINTAQLLHLIATEPLILAVRLADKFECDTDDIETALLPHINRRVFAREAKGPNGLPAIAYELSDEYRAEVLARPVPRDPDVERRAAIREAAPALNMDAACERIQSPAPFGAPAKPSEPRLTKPQMAIDYLKTMPGNRCTHREMCRALSLPPSSQPNAYLTSAVKDGRLKRDGLDWMLGTAPLDSVVAVGNIIVASKDASPIPQAVVDAVTSAPVVAQLAAPVGTALAQLEDLPVPVVQPQFTAPTSFRCGIWSDGILELQRGGQVVASLTREECAQVVAFLEARAA